METQSKWEIERDERRQKTEQEAKQALQVFEQVGKLLGYTVKQGENEWYFSLVDTDGHSISISGFISDQYRYKGKYNISGNYSYYPRDCGAIKYDGSLPEIGIGIQKTPEQIAKEIQRRFLPEYLEIEAKCKAYKAKKENRIENRNNVLTQLAEYAGTVFTKCTWKNTDATETFSLPKSLGTVESYDGEEFTLTARGLSIEQMKAILDILK